MSDKAIILSKEQAERIFKDKQKYIKRTIRKKIAIYEPLDVKSAYTGFTEWVQTGDFNMFRSIPGNCAVDVYLDDLIKNFLIEHAYYALSEKYIQRILMNKLGAYDPNELKVLETGDFIRERLEKDGLKRLKGFKEKCKFKTFLTTAVIRLLYDSWRQKGSKDDQLTKYGPEFEALFDPPIADPFSRLIRLEDEQFKNKAAEFLPRVLDKLDAEEKLAIKMKYEKGMKISPIARALSRTRFKTEQLIKQIEMNISMKILSEVKKGGSHETS
jgi:RNA polymerase sigma factor (sigma-70 family)